jgi:sortase A
MEILSPFAVEEMTSGDWDMTLFTCTVGGQSRVTVRCVLEERAYA